MNKRTIRIAVVAGAALAMSLAGSGAVQADPVEIMIYSDVATVGVSVSENMGCAPPNPKCYRMCVVAGTSGTWNTALCPGIE